MNRCNCACLMCPYSYTVALEDKTEMTEEMFNNIINQLVGQKDFESLFFAFQNEPLLDERIINWAKRYKEKLPNKRLELVTNGSLLTPETAKQVYKYFDLVHVSLNAFSAESHKKISGTEHYPKIYNNLINISKIVDQRNKTIVRFIRQKANYQEKKLFYDYWRKRGFMVFGFDVNDRLKGVRDFDNKIKLPSNSLKKIKMFALKYVAKLLLPTCPIPFICLYIKADGGIVQCFNDWTNNHILENINEKSISEIFKSKKYIDIRKKLLENKLDENVICSKCDLYKEGIWLTA
ncbi:MAG: radical SAM protein [Candidatus Parcubacteria bacterium]|nr:radical SAM protein [Candidatus Parcubacteria bacterium]